MMFDHDFNVNHILGVNIRDVLDAVSSVHNLGHCLAEGDEPDPSEWNLEGVTKEALAVVSLKIIDLLMTVTDGFVPACSIMEAWEEGLREHLTFNN